MKEGPDIARLAALIGDPARANILTALMSGRALTAGELAAEAGVTPQTASAHLARLEAGALIRLRKQGRHRYFAIADEHVAAALETLMGLAAGQGPTRLRTGPRDPALRKARVCYDHLAGEMGCRLHDHLMAEKLLTASSNGLDLSPEGVRFVKAFGVDPEKLRSRRAPLCRECLDWSTRRSHLAGALGRAMLARIEALGWARRIEGARVLAFTPAGESAFDRAFPLPDRSRASAASETRFLGIEASSPGG